MGALLRRGEKQKATPPVGATIRRRVAPPVLPTVYLPREIDFRTLPGVNVTRCAGGTTFYIDPVKK